jgi:tetratricopeptide (TPR) repeat protein
MLSNQGLPPNGGRAIRADSNVIMPSIDSETKLCFVIMGFGKKTDYETGRTLDLNATYEAIIKPAAQSAGLRCIRADEVMHSGIIDLSMYEMLLRADLVIADISTGNANALYELGVRHALRPFSTVIMKESKGRLYFDLNHVNTFIYDHLGDDIGFREATRAQSELLALILSVLEKPRPDSPVYTFLPRLVQPRLSDEEFEELVQRSEKNEETLAAHIRSGETALREDRPADAARAFRAAADIKPADAYLIQQLALATYKSESPSKIAALVSALQIISVLDPANSNDPETTGITGAIHKRLWFITDDRNELDLAIRYYQRGFDMRKDYYNGENLALCLSYRASKQIADEEQVYDTMRARKVRERLREILQDVLSSDQFLERSDQKWVLATMANTLYALGDTSAVSYEERFMSMKKDGKLSDWEVETYKTNKEDTLRLLGPPRKSKSSRNK